MLKVPEACSDCGQITIIQCAVCGDALCPPCCGKSGYICHKCKPKFLSGGEFYCVPKNIQKRVDRKITDAVH